MKLLAISPHLDDAAFSAGGTLAQAAARGDAVVVLTCFTGNVARPTGFALACQLDKGLGPEVDYMALRRAEDRAACAVIGARAVHLPLLEAPHRGYASPPELFAGRRADDAVLAPLVEALAAAIGDEAPDLVLGPMGIGDHVDHHLVREALASAAAGLPLWLWQDWPYLDRPGVAAGDPVDRTVALDDAARAARIAMCGAYQSQLGFQFGSREGMEARLRRIAVERFATC